MSDARRIAVVLAGGSGERFWPLSRPDRPKQFLDIAGDGQTLLESAFERAERFASERGTYLATLEHLVEPSLEAVEAADPERTLVEPARRDTAGAMIWAVANLMARHPEAGDALQIAVLSSDHRIPQVEAFVQTAEDAIELARETDGLVVIGVRPTRPETGYGYVEVGDAYGTGHRVRQFREKPNLDTAEDYLESGRFLWNSGMFFWTVGAFVRELRQARPEMADILLEVRDRLLDGDEAGSVAAFERLPKISIDIALMERAERTYVVEARFEWDDLGSWDALSRVIELDRAGNALQGDVRAIDSADCVVHTEAQKVHLLGAEDLVVVVTAEAVLVMPRSQAQEVKKLTQRPSP